MNVFRSAGFVIGIVIGLIACVVLFKISNTNHKSRTEYDERQQEIRGKAYRYAFYVLAVYEAVMVCITIGEIPLPLGPAMQHALGIFISCTFLAAYCIKHDVYWGLNNNPKRYSIIFLVAGLINAIPVVASIASGTFFENGQVTSVLINLLALIMIVVIGVELLIKKAAARREED